MQDFIVWRSWKKVQRDISQVLSEVGDNPQAYAARGIKRLLKCHLRREMNRRSSSEFNATFLKNRLDALMHQEIGIIGVDGKFSTHFGRAVLFL